MRLRMIKKKVMKQKKIPIHLKATSQFVSKYSCEHTFQWGNSNGTFLLEHHISSRIDCGLLPVGTVHS